MRLLRLIEGPVFNRGFGVCVMDAGSSAQLLGIEREIYKKRFSESEQKVRDLTWKVLMRDFFRSRIDERATVMDIGAGDGHFLRNVRAERRIAVDLGEHVLELEKEGIEVILASAMEIPQNLNNKIDVIMMSNFLEHLPTKLVLLDVLERIKDLLSDRGKLLILQPNIKYTGPRYWDYIDHHIALTEESLAEALKIKGYEVKELIPRFLPYTAKSTLGKISGNNAELFVKMYLKFPILWKIFGCQTFIEAEMK